MENTAINSDSDLAKLLEQIWTTPLGLKASQDLHEGVLLEQHYEGIYVATALKTVDGWVVTDGKAPSTPTMRIFYSIGACEELAQTTSLEDFSNKLQDLIGIRNIVFIPMRSPEKLMEAGFSEFAERLGLPGK